MGEVMALTGTALLVVLLVLVAVMPAAVVWMWPRTHGNRWLVVGQRVGLVVVAQLTALLLAAVALNDYGNFFSSWSQAARALFGSTPHTALGNQGLGDLRSYGAPSAPAAPVSVTRVTVSASDRLPPELTPTRWSKPADYQRVGALATMPLLGPASQLEDKVAVYLPAAYFTGARSLPLVEMITGYPSTYSSWTHRLHLPQQFVKGIDNHSMGPMVLVMTPVGLPYPLDSECTDAPGGPFAFTYFDKDLPAVMSSVLGLHPPAMGAIGYSTGGYCATKLAMLDPSRFRAAVSMSGYFYAQPGKYSPSLYGGSRQVRHLNDLRWRLSHLPVPPASILVMTGTEELGPDGWVQNNKFLALVRPPMHAERFIVPVDFGHSYGTWTQEVSPALVWMSRSLGAASGNGDIGSALFSRQGLHRHHHRRHHHRAVPAPQPSQHPTVSPSPRPTRSPSQQPLNSGTPPTATPS
jgi:hypothetical protein